MYVKIEADTTYEKLEEIPQAGPAYSAGFSTPSPGPYQ